MSENESIKKYYDEVYHQGASNVGYYRNHLKRLGSKIDIRPGERILDVACGTGEWLKVAHEFGAEPSGIDLSSTAVAYCKQKLPSVEIHEGPAESLPFPSKQFDIVSCLGALEHFMDPEKALKEMARVGRDTARFLVLVPNEGFLPRRLGLFRGTRQVVVREIVRPLHEWEAMFQRSGLRVEKRWKDLHIVSMEWIFSGSLPRNLMRLLSAVIIMFLPIALQYQVYFLCYRKERGTTSEQRLISGTGESKVRS
ncbi:MAG: methyltransferase domain-containing protein [Gammaproteobacteria bacterium]|nr:methyltransferase domain-containing protein [Gammaproteobacteria bacterium]